MGFIPIGEAVWELKTLTFYRDVVIEGLVNFLLVFLCFIGSTRVNENVPAPLIVGLIAGLYVYTLIEAFGHLQFSTMNPVATLAFVCTKRISFIKGIVYVAAQMTGGTAGAALAMACLPESSQDYMKAITPADGVSNPQAIIIELMIAGTLCFVILGCLDEDRRELTVPGLAMGVAIAMGITAAGPISGGGMNPSVVFAVAASIGNWDRHWVYWVGDMAGSILAITLYTFFIFDKGLFAPKNKRSAKNSAGDDPVVTTYSVQDDDHPGSSSFIKMSAGGKNGHTASSDDAKTAV